MVSLGQQQPGRKPSRLPSDVGTIVTGHNSNLPRPRPAAGNGNPNDWNANVGTPNDWNSNVTGPNRPFVFDLSGGGNTWKNLSSQFGISVDRLKALNPDINVLKKQDDGFLRLRRMPGAIETQEGDTWRTVAERYGLTPQQLRELNPNLGPLRDADPGTRLRLRPRPAVQNSLDPWDAIQLNEQRFDINQGLASTLADIDFNRGMENLRYSQTRDNVLNNLGRNLEDLQRQRGIDMTQLIDRLGARGLTGSGVANRFRNLATEGFDTARSRTQEDADRQVGQLADTNLAFNSGLDTQASAAEQLRADLLQQALLREQYLRTQGAAGGVNAGGA